MVLIKKIIVNIIKLQNIKGRIPPEKRNPMSGMLVE
jgi:hypothetical protein